MPLTDNCIFELDENVTRKPVSYKNRFGITIAADLYQPKVLDESQEHAAICPEHGPARLRRADLRPVAQRVQRWRAAPRLVPRHLRRGLQRRRRLSGHATVRGPRAELYVVRNAGHVDLYDKVDLIPFDKLEEFFTENLTSPSSDAAGELVGSES